MRRIALSVCLAATGIMGLGAAAPNKEQEQKVALERQLQSRYALAKLAPGGNALLEGGTVFVLQRQDLRAAPSISIKSYMNTYKDYKFRYSLGDAMVQDKNLVRMFGPGEPFFLIRAEPKDNGVVLNLVTANLYEGVLYKAAVTLPFPKGYLARMDAEQVHRAVMDVFAVNQGQPPAAQNAPPPPPMAAPAPAPQEPPAAAPPAPAPAPAAEPVRIGLGQTPEQVVGALGQPDKLIKLGEKEIYVYKDLKVTFVNGKVTDVQ